jgi:hypothetical protein
MKFLLVLAVTFALYGCGAGGATYDPQQRAESLKNRYEPLLLDPDELARAFGKPLPLSFVTSSVIEESALPTSRQEQSYDTFRALELESAFRETYALPQSSGLQDIHCGVSIYPSADLAGRALLETSRLYAPIFGEIYSEKIYPVAATAQPLDSTSHIDYKDARNFGLYWFVNVQQGRYVGTVIVVGYPNYELDAETAARLVSALRAKLPES